MNRVHVLVLGCIAFASLVTVAGLTTAAMGEPRTLDEITIEGEVAVPQVLFITARDQQRYLDDLHHKYLRSAIEIARDATVPTRVEVIEATVPQVGPHHDDTAPKNGSVDD